MPLKATDFPKNKKQQVFVEGYAIDCVNDLTPGQNVTEDTVHVYGRDNPINDARAENGTLSMGVIEKTNNNKLLDVLHRYDPDDGSNRAYNWANIRSASAWWNRKDEDNEQYEKSCLYKDWTPVPGHPAGAANERGVRTFAGNCENPREFNQPILAEKIAVSSGAGGYTGSLSKKTPVEDPDNASHYALSVVAIEETRSGTEITSFDMEDMDVTPSMVDSNGDVTIQQSDLDQVGGPNYAYVLYLYNKSGGVHPDDVSPDGLLEDVS